MMGLNFNAALGTLSKALTLVLFRAVIFVSGGFAVIFIFGVLFYSFRPGAGADPLVALFILVPFVIGGWAGVRWLQRSILFRQRAAMLFLFSGRQPAIPGSAGVLQETKRFFPDYSSWVALNRSLGKALAGPVADDSGSNSYFGAFGALRQAVLAMAFARAGSDAGRAIREALDLFFKHGEAIRKRARQWSFFSLAGLAFLFLCLALPNWIFFKGAGAPVWIGIVLAAAISWMLHRAFVVPFVLAGLSAALLAATSGEMPDQRLFEKVPF